MLESAYRVRHRLFLFALSVIGLIGFASPVVAGPPATVTLLNGETVSGDLAGLTLDQVQLETEQGIQEIDAKSVMQLELNASAVETGDAKFLTVTGNDQSQLQVTSMASDGTSATLESPAFGTMTMPLRQLGDILLGTLDAKVTGSWQDLRTRNSRDDLLVIRKGEVLDYVGGSIAKVSADSVTMLVRGRELSAPRDRVFGVVLATPAAVPAARRIAIRTISGDLIQAASLQLDGDVLKVKSASLGDVNVPVNRISNLDFGGGRIRFLTDLAFDASESKSPGPGDPVVWFVSKNSPAGSGGKSVLRIGQNEFKRGLWLHSGAVLRYRLNREYTRLRTTAGFELTHVTQMPRFEPKVRLVILGDGKELLSKEFAWDDAPVPVDLDIADVRDLSIQIDSLGASQGILEHFGLGDAQVIR
ncbi:NPCBM/NEW2 domain-containing protein [Planctomicrobium sp. SH527]|uniref:NPCBM/NEW2 domain-containing protein n=1 Tax=Planctomicrobium sp. SH527 TaxID=3448123 RepID=UPI003F5BDA7B